MERRLSRKHSTIKIKDTRLSLGHTCCHLHQCARKKISPASSVCYLSLLLGLSACIGTDLGPEGLQMCAEVGMGHTDK